MLVCNYCGNLREDSEFLYDKKNKKYIPLCLYCCENDKELPYRLGYKKHRKNKKESTRTLTIRIKPSDYEKIEELFLDTDWNDSRIFNEIIKYILKNKRIVKNIIGN